MLEKTFVHIPGVAYLTEKRLWQRGIRCWADALVCEEAPGSFSAARWQLVRDHSRDSMTSLAARDHRFFSETLAARDHWRAYQEFRDRIAYVDIETDGSYYGQAITVVGVYDGTSTRSFVKGDNLEEFAEEIEKYAMLVTFNGATFDLPILRRAFRGVDWSHLHIDLRYVMSKLGYRGGLKHIERETGLCRAAELTGLGGEDAIYLWNEYRRGSTDALELLLAYNAADVENLKCLLEMAFPRLQAELESCLTT